MIEGGPTCASGLKEEEEEEMHSRMKEKEVQ